MLFTHDIYVEENDLGDYGVDKLEEALLEGALLEEDYEEIALLEEEYNTKELSNTDNGDQGFYILEGE